MFRLFYTLSLCVLSLSLWTLKQQSVASTQSLTSSQTGTGYSCITPVCRVGISCVDYENGTNPRSIKRIPTLHRKVCGYNPGHDTCPDYTGNQCYIYKQWDVYGCPDTVHPFSTFFDPEEGITACS